ncbi:MAG: methionine adenosyltransferase [Candidatus Marinimicrobia bacterium]|nr:methionine adenosyltransferase [Candidatus Neomarinimicrobiota bacterium]|tara:strand:+ start:2942 stop:4117 length:1176 start_codon:yes stop_codon:yes gene_type:complete
MSKFLFTSESVTEGHPDKACDAFSDAILDEILSNDNEAHVACESLATKGLVVISGEVRTTASIDVDKVVKDTIRTIGYHKENSGVDPEDVEVLSKLHEQSPEIAQGVDSHDTAEQGAGDQGLMFGFACKETPELMPLPIQISHRLTERLTQLRKDGTLPWLRPDGKSQVSVRYDNRQPIAVDKTVIATQHDDMLSEYGSESGELEFVRSEVIEHVIRPVLDSYGYAYEDNFIVNGTGRFVYGGPEADTGLTGRKIIVDTYGGYAPHGGGAFSGKDPSKVDRSATYMARYIAKNIVAADLAERCEVQLSYGIGVAEPTSFYVKTQGTGKKDDDEITRLARDVFPIKPGEIVAHLDLKKPRYRQTAAYGHFGRELDQFTWEKTDMVETLLKNL